MTSPSNPGAATRVRGGSVSATTLPRIIHAFSVRFPDVRVVLLDQQYDDVIESIEAGTADLAVIAVDGGLSA